MKEMSELSQAVIAKIRFPFFSIRHIESYQVAVSYPVVFPSTLVGAFGYALSLLGKCRGDECIKQYSKYIYKAREFASDDIVAVKSPMILKRFRILEPPKEGSNKSEGGKKYKFPRNFKEISKSMDAMVREYIFTLERSYVFIVKNDIDTVKKAVKLIDRLGDSESLVSVVDVREEELEECDVNDVNVMLKSGYEFTETTLLYGPDENGVKSLFAIPYKLKDYALVFSPIRVKRGILCSKSVRIPKEGDW